MGLYVDPGLNLVIDFYNPGSPLPVNVDGLYRVGDKNLYTHRQEQIAPYAGAPQRLVIPVYYDEIVSISCWKGPTIASGNSCFIHAFVCEGPIQNQVRVNTLFSGWCSDCNPVGYPLVDREDKEDALSNLYIRNCTLLPAGECYYSPPIGTPIKVVGLKMVCVLAAGGPNRTFGIGTNDGGAVYYNLSMNASVFAGGTTVTLYASNGNGATVTVGNNLFFPLPTILIRNPWQIASQVIGLQPGDAFSSGIVVVRPYFDY